MKIIKYDIFQSKREDGTDITAPKEVFCYTQAHFDINYPIAEREAIPGTIEVTGEFDPEPETPETGDVVTWAALNAAYQEGVDSV